MSEPKVEFELNDIKDLEIREQFDQFRRWYEFREDIGTPTFQTFEGTLADDESINLYVPGVVYGQSGMSQFVSTELVWRPMRGTSGTGVCYFAFDVENVDGNYVKVICNSNTNQSLQFRATVFYKDA